MKRQLFSALFLSAILATGCSKNEGGASSSAVEESGVQAQVGPSVILSQISEEKDFLKKSQLILKSTTSGIEESDLNQIIKMHQEKRLTTEEFRTLFWNKRLSKESLSLLKKDLENDKELSDLDSTLIQSIENDDLHFEDLLFEIKKNTDPLPVTFQNNLLDEMIKLYIKDFDNVNADQDSFKEKMSKTQNEKTDVFLGRLEELLRLTYFKKLLSNNRLVTKKNTNAVMSREIQSGFHLDYNLSIGRRGGFSGSIDFDKLQTGYGQKYETQTPSIVNLDIYSGSSDFMGAKSYELLVHTFVRGGYDKDKGENATSTLNYNISGKIVIPRCSNPMFCDQIVSVFLGQPTKSYPDSSFTNEGVTIKLNGNVLNLDSSEMIYADVSEKDAVIDVSFTTSKRHVGACCFSGGATQKANIIINSGYKGMINFPFEKFKSTAIFDPEMRGMYGYLPPVSSNLNTPPIGVGILKQRIEDALKDKEKADIFRYYFYSELLRVQMIEDELILRNTNPIAIAQYRQTRSAISDLIGRQLILPVVIGKNAAYQATSASYVQKNINKMFNSILAMNLNADNDRREISEIVKLKTSNFNNDGQNLANRFLESVSAHADNSADLLASIEKFQSEFIFMSKKMALEMEVLNLEQAQFSELKVDQGK